jgi:hypothetical protein
MNWKNWIEHIVLVDALDNSIDLGVTLCDPVSISSTLKFTSRE